MRRVPSWLIWVCAIPPAYFLFDVPAAWRNREAVMSGAVYRNSQLQRAEFGAFLLLFAALAVFSFARSAPRTQPFRLREFKTVWFYALGAIAASAVAVAVQEAWALSGWKAEAQLSAQKLADLQVHQWDVVKTEPLASEKWEIDAAATERLARKAKQSDPDAFMANRARKPAK